MLAAEPRIEAVAICSPPDVRCAIALDAIAARQARAAGKAALQHARRTAPDASRGQARRGDADGHLAFPLQPADRAGPRDPGGSAGVGHRDDLEGRRLLAPRAQVMDVEAWKLRRFRLRHQRTLDPHRDPAGAAGRARRDVVGAPAVGDADRGRNRVRRRARGRPPARRDRVAYAGLSSAPSRSPPGQGGGCGCRSSGNAWKSMAASWPRRGTGNTSACTTGSPACSTAPSPTWTTGPWLPSRMSLRSPAGFRSKPASE